MIECGLGIGFLPVHLADPYAARGDLFHLPPYENEPSATVFLITNQAVSLSEAEQVLLEEMQRNSNT